MSKGSIYAFLKNYALTPGYKKVFIAFDGVEPTPAELEALYNENNELKLTDVVALGQPRGYFVYGTDFVAESVTPTLYRWIASERIEDMSVVSLGEVNWFIFAIVDDTVTDLTSVGMVYDAFVGAISDVGDDGDVFIPAKKIGANQSYLLNDLEINYWN